MVKKILTLCLLLSSSVMLSAQSLHPEKNAKGKYGYFNAVGKKIIDYKYDDATTVKDGIAYVRKDDKWGLISDTGKEILKTDYAEISQFSNGMARVKKGNAYGFVDRNGKVIIDVKYEFVGTPNEEGYFWVADGKTLASASKGLYKHDKLIIKPEYDEIGVFAKDGDVDMTDGNCYNLTQAKQITKNFDVLPKTTCNYFWCVKGGKTGLINQDGQIVIKLDKYFMSVPSEGLVAIAKVSGKKYEYNYISTDGKESKLFKKSNVVEASVEKELQPLYCPFINGIAMNRVHKEYYLIDTSGAKVSDTFTDAISVVGKGFLVCCNGKWGTINSSGTYQIQPTYANIKSTSDEEAIFAAKKDANGKWGFVDFYGKSIVPFQYENAGLFVKGRGYVKSTKGWGIVDRNNNNIIEPKWADIISTNLDDAVNIWVKDASDKKWYSRKLSNDTPAFKDGYSVVSSYDVIENRQLAIVGTDKSFGIIDVDGNTIVPIKFSSKELATTALLYLNNTLEKDKMDEFDALRFNISQNPDRNKTKLSAVVSEDLWDF